MIKEYEEAYKRVMKRISFEQLSMAELIICDGIVVKNRHGNYKCNVKDLFNRSGVISYNNSIIINTIEGR